MSSVLASTERSRCSIAAASVGSDADFTSRSAKRSCLPDRPDSRRIARRAAERKSIVMSSLIAFPRWLRVSLRLVTAARPRAYQSLCRRDAHRYSHPNESIRVGCAEGGSRPRAWHSRPSLIWTRALRSLPETSATVARYDRLLRHRWSGRSSGSFCEWHCRGFVESRLAARRACSTCQSLRSPSRDRFRWLGHGRSALPLPQQRSHTSDVMACPPAPPRHVAVEPYMRTPSPWQSSQGVAL